MPTTELADIHEIVEHLRKHTLGGEHDEEQVVDALVRVMDRRPDLRKLLKPADVAFLRAKQGGKGRYAFDESKHPRGQPENAGEFAPKAGGGETTPTAFDNLVSYQGQKITTRDFLIRVRKLQPNRPTDDRFNNPHRERVELFVAKLIHADIDSGKDALYDANLGTTYLSGVKGRDPLVMQDQRGVMVSWGTDSKDRIVRLEPDFDEAEAETKLRKLLKMKAKGGDIAAQYARDWNDLRAAGRNVSRDEITAAASDLAGTGVYVAWNASDDAPGWEAVPASVVDAVMGRYARDGEPGGGVMFGGEVHRGEYAFKEEDHLRDSDGKFTKGTGATKGDVDEAHNRLTSKLEEISKAENVKIDERQYLGQVKDFYPAHEKLHPKTAGTHVYFDPTVKESSAAGRVRKPGANLMELGQEAFDGKGSSGSLGDTFVHELEHLEDDHTHGIEATEFTPRLRQMLRELVKPEEALNFLRRKSGEDDAKLHVGNFFEFHPGHELTDEEREIAVRALIAKAQEVYGSEN